MKRKWNYEMQLKLKTQTGFKRKMGHLIQHKTDYEYDCSCGGEPKYVESEWKWRCRDCGAKNY